MDTDDHVSKEIHPEPNSRTEHRVNLPSKKEGVVFIAPSDTTIQESKEVDWENRCNNEELNIGKTTTVGLFPAGKSECGTLDMAGNAFEWCRTGCAYRGGDCEATTEDLESYQAFRIVRGGSCSTSPRMCRCDSSRRWAPLIRALNCGFRVASLSTKSSNGLSC